MSTAPDAVRVTPATDAVVVAYQSSDVVLECVRSLRADRAVASIIVVNNSPGDSTCSKLADLRDVRCVESSKNLGFGPAINRVRGLVSQPYVTFANPDTWQEEETCSRLVEFLEARPNAAVAGPRMYTAAGALYRNAKFASTLWRMIGEAVGLGHWLGQSRPARDHLEAHRTDYVIGSFLVCRVRALDEINWFDESIFLFGEDEDLCRRLRIAGWEVWFAATGRVTHFSGHSWRQLSDEGRRLFRAARRRELRASQGPLHAAGFEILVRLRDVVSAATRRQGNQPLPERVLGRTGRFARRAARYFRLVWRSITKFGPHATFLAVGAKSHGAAQKLVEFAEFVSFLRPIRPKMVVEIGTLNGGTLWALCRLASSAAELTSIDLPGGPFGGGYGEGSVSRLRALARTDQKIHLIRGDSHALETLEQLEAALRGRSIDLLFIDGDHSYEGVKRDFELYSPLVRPGGMIAFHDILPHSNPACQVDLFWNEIRIGAEHYEFVDRADDARGAWGGIGVIIKEVDAR